MNKKEILGQSIITYENVKGQSLYTGDESCEINRINSQNEFLNKIVSPYLDLVFSFYENPNILDIGCSDGRNIILRLKNRNYHSLLGLDKNQNKIQTANELYKSDKNSFLCYDINSKDLRKYLFTYIKKKDIPGFDIIHISSVLLHIKNPSSLLNILHDFLSEQGRIFIQDEDDGLNKIYPWDSRFEDCFYVWEHSIESGDRYMGRKIPFYLHENGYSDIKILSSNITSLDFDDSMRNCFWDLYFNSNLWVANNESFYDTPDAYNRFITYSRNHDQLKKTYMDGGFFIMLGVLFITAKK